MSRTRDSNFGEISAVYVSVASSLPFAVERTPSLSQYVTMLAYSDFRPMKLVHGLQFVF